MVNERLCDKQEQVTDSESFRIEYWGSHGLSSNIPCYESALVFGIYKTTTLDAYRTNPPRYLMAIKWNLGGCIPRFWFEVFLGAGYPGKYKLFCHLPHSPFSFLHILSVYTLVFDRRVQFLDSNKIGSLTGNCQEAAVKLGLRRFCKPSYDVPCSLPPKNVCQAQ